MCVLLEIGRVFWRRDLQKEDRRVLTKTGFALRAPHTTFWKVCQRGQNWETWEAIASWICGRLPACSIFKATIPAPGPHPASGKTSSQEPPVRATPEFNMYGPQSDTIDFPAFRALVATLARHTIQEASNVLFWPSWEKFHAVVLKGVRNIPDILQHCSRKTAFSPFFPP